VSGGKSKATIGEDGPTLAIATKMVAWTVYVFLMAPIFVVIGMSFGSQYEYQFPPRSISLFPI